MRLETRGCTEGISEPLNEGTEDGILVFQRRATVNFRASRLHFIYQQLNNLNSRVVSTQDYWPESCGSSPAFCSHVFFSFIPPPFLKDFAGTIHKVGIESTTSELEAVCADHLATQFYFYWFTFIILLHFTLRRNLKMITFERDFELGFGFFD